MVGGAQLGAGNARGQGPFGTQKQCIRMRPGGGRQSQSPDHTSPAGGLQLPRTMAPGAGSSERSFPGDSMGTC